jgi:hypothetical protein
MSGGDQTQQQGGRHHRDSEETRQAPLPVTGYLHHRLQSIAGDIFFKLIWHKGFQLKP